MIYKYAIIGAGYALALTFFWLFLDAREDLAAERVQCNADKLATAQESSEIARKAQKESDDRRIAELARRAERAERAAAVQAEEVEASKQGQAELSAELERLKLESFDDDDAEESIADSGACLNTYLPIRPYRLLYAQNRGEAGARPGNRGGPGARPGQIPASAWADFAPVTFGDALDYWREDRARVMRCEADKLAIRELMP